MRIPFIGQTYNTRSSNFDASRSINFYVEISQEENSKSPIALVGTPGTSRFLSSFYSPIRALYVFDNVLYVVASNVITAYDKNGNFIKTVGKIETYIGRVSIKDNGLSSYGLGGNQLMIADGEYGYIYDVVAGTFETITSPGMLPKPTNIVYIDGYFVAINNTMKTSCSNLYDGKTWNPLASTPISSANDVIKGVIAWQQQVWFIKQWSSEVWFDSGTPTTEGFPFSRVSGAVLDYGTEAPWSIAKGGDTILFLGYQKINDKNEFVGVIAFSGYTGVVVSNMAINYRISKSTDLTQCFAYCYAEEGHVFYVLTNPVDNWTFVYDLTTQLWHERSTYLGREYEVTRHIGNCYCYFDNKHLIGGYNDTNIYEMSSKYYTDNGLPIISERTTSVVWDKGDNDSITVSRIIVDAETGVGDAYTNLTPHAGLSWSDDSGHKWSNEYLASMGAVGEYKTRLLWRRLGKARNKIFKLRVSDAVKKVIIGAYIKAR